MPSPRRPRLAAAALALAAVAALSAWAVYDAVHGARSLQRASDQVQAVRDADDAAALADGLRAAAASTADAQDRLGNPVLRVAGAVPGLGEPLALARVLARATDLAVRQGALPLLEVAGRDVEDRLVRADGAVDVALLRRLARPAEDAAAALQSAEDLLRSAPRDSGVARLDDARAEVRSELSELRPAVQELALAAQLGPDLLGAEQPRRYLVVPQNPAEARGTGGLIGGYILLEARDGRLSVVESQPNTVLFRQDREVDGPVLDLGEEFDAHYGLNGALEGWVNSNLSPHFPYAGRTWRALWEERGGPALDGVLAVDPVALSYLLGPSGPVQVPGGPQVTSANAVDLLLRDVYALSDDDEVRNAYLQQVSSAVATALTTRGGLGRPLLEALARSVRERRLLLWLADERAQQELGARDLTGQLPDGPAVGDVVVNASGSKLDYYLERQLTYRVGCADRQGRVAVRLTNAAPASGLPEYVSPAQFRQGLPPGTNKSIVWLYVPPGARPGELRVDGVATPYRSGLERRLGWVEAFVTLRPGQSVDIELDFADTTREGGDADVIRQPLVREETVSRTPC